LLYSCILSEWNPELQVVTTPTLALIETQPDCFEVPQYHESALYDDLESVKSSKSSEYNNPDQETIQFMNEVGRSKREACLPAKPSDADSTRTGFMKCGYYFKYSLRVYSTLYFVSKIP